MKQTAKGISYILGQKSDILDLLDRLNKDTRHTTPTITSLEYVEERLYPDWSMEQVVLSQDSYFIMSNLLSCLASSLDVLRIYTQPSVVESMSKVTTETIKV